MAAKILASYLMSFKTVLFNFIERLRFKLFGFAIGLKCLYSHTLLCNTFLVCFESGALLDTSGTMSQTI